jgi:hypothetical protein
VKPKRLLSAIVFAVVTGAAVGCQANGRPNRAAAASSAEAPTRALVERVYLGVSCPLPNRVACDQVGLYVSLSRPARRIDAHIDGRSLTLRERAAPSIRPGTHWEAFLENAGLDDGLLAVQTGPDGKWMGEPDVIARVRLTLRFAGQPSVTRVLRTPLRVGYC